MEIDVSEWVFDYRSNSGGKMRPVMSDSYVADFYRSPCTYLGWWPTCPKSVVVGVHSKGLVRW